MATVDKNIGSLPAATSLEATDLFHIRQGSVDKKIAASALIDLLPSGAQGEQGIQGIQGVPGPSGPPGPTSGALVIGASASPLGETFSYPHPSSYGEQIQNPILFQRMKPFHGSGTLYPEYWLDSRIFMDTKRWAAQKGNDDFYYRLEWTSTTLLFALYTNSGDAWDDTNRLASRSFDDPGFYPIVDETDAKTVWGYIFVPELWYDINLTETLVGTLDVLGSDYHIREDMITEGSRFELEFLAFAGSPGEVSEMTFTVTGSQTPGGIPTFGEFTYPLTIHGSGDGYIFGRVTIECLRASWEGGFMDFRTTLRVHRGDPGKSPIDDYQVLQPQEVSVQMNGNPYLSQIISIHQTAEDGGETDAAFWLVSSSGMFLSAPSSERVWPS